MSSRDEPGGGGAALAASGGRGAGPRLMGVEVCVVDGGGAAAGDEPARKRPRLPGAGGADEAPRQRQRLLDHKLQRAATLCEASAELLSELYFLQGGGNMMDYVTWRKRPPPPQLTDFLEARRLPPPPPEAPPPPELASAPPPAPVAAPPPAPPPALSAADEMVEKARQEAYVAGRVSELVRAGLWAERRLPRVLEPPRPKTHWDYLLEEMAWLAQDFAHERKWKKQAAKKCARAVQKHFQDKALAQQRAERAQELQLRRVAAAAARAVRTFWANVEKLVEWKRVRRVERARKQALDEQLSYMVDRTELYSRQLAAKLHGGEAGAGDGGVSDDEFTPRGASDDDEETIAAEERASNTRAADHRAELDALRRDSELELRALLPPGYEEAPASPRSDYSAGGESSADDEDTIAEQERVERADHAAELDALRADAELSVEELLRRYQPGRAPPPPPPTDLAEPQPQPQPEDDDTCASSDESRCSSPASSAGSSRLEALVDTDAGAEAGGGGESAEHGVEAAAQLAASLQPTGTTLADTAVGTPVPALLRHALREYQHVGLHWLATMHARRLNGILADEMGLGKTIQSIALLAHLAARGCWGPHLVVAPTSVVLNWEMEFKKWCPAFKILTYYGTIKERKLKRVGWTKPNSFHVCITSYKLVVQDHQSFRRKKWVYLILDEAQNIKNFKSQRWQMLLNFQTESRLLLTGTPLQNSLLELWSLMHFLMPSVFASHSHFREWFTPVAGLAEREAAGDTSTGTGGGGGGDALVRRLHEVLRPFLLRRLKRDVERQMPRKYEHVVLCRLAKRQRALYDDFMARAHTRAQLASGGLLGVINVLMQLRKVCNHPDLFEPRPVHSPLALRALGVAVPALVLRAGAALLQRALLAERWGGALAASELAGAQAFPAHRARHLAPPRRLLEELPPCADSAAPPAPPAAPPLRLHLRLVPRAPHPPPHRPPPPPLKLDAPHIAPTAAPISNSIKEAGTNAGAGSNSGGGAGETRLAARRRACLRRLGGDNERRCWRLPLYGADLRAALCCAPVALPAPLAPPDLRAALLRHWPLVARFSACCTAALAPAPELRVGGGALEWRARVASLERAAESAARPLHALLHAAAARQRVAFPHPSLLQYDCGKLQTLATLLRRLERGGHRALIFTQMTRVLDVLEAFLSRLGLRYLRLDGSTRVEARQALVERFNGDARVFAMILSTRSGGVGLNLTGADSVVFYDSDWNPTMDAQAQDRAHRIGQTRDVHVYRLVTAATVEENILRKAAQKRALSHLAIDHGHFTTSYLRQANIAEIFGADVAQSVPGAAPADEEGALESALAAAEDEADARAAAAARDEARKDLAEFDETQPIDDEPPPPPAAPAAPAEPAEPEAEPELAALMKQLTPVEKYAMRLVESSEAASEAERAALESVRRALREWERARAALRDGPPARAASPAPDALTYCREDAHDQVWLRDVSVAGCGGGGGGGDLMPVWLRDVSVAGCGGGGGGGDLMPMWSPPTPPGAAGDVYCEQWSRALYRPGAAAEHLLPAGRAPPRAAPHNAARSPRHAQRARTAHAPPSLFERSVAPHPRPPRHARHAHAPPPHAAPAHAAHPPPEWSAPEEAALRRALRLQRLPAEPPLAHLPNWEWCAELVGEVARAYRGPRACRDAHDALADPARRHASRKKARTAALPGGGGAGPHLARLDAMREAGERRRAAPKRRTDEAPPHHNAKHAALLAEHGVEYDAPPSPMDVASRRADRIAKEKLKSGAGTVPPAAPAAPPAAPAAPAAPPPQRIVVAAESARRAAPSGAASSAGVQLYRQQSIARQQLKILHHPHHQGVVTSEGGGLRTLQLQQLAVRRGAAVAGVAGAAGVGAGAGGARVLAASRPHAPHVVVAHLAPAPPAHPQHPQHTQHPQHDAHHHHADRQ